MRRIRRIHLGGFCNKLRSKKIKKIKTRIPRKTPRNQQNARTNLHCWFSFSEENNSGMNERLHKETKQLPTGGSLVIVRFYIEDRWSKYCSSELINYKVGYKNEKIHRTIRKIACRPLFVKMLPQTAVRFLFFLRFIFKLHSFSSQPCNVPTAAHVKLQRVYMFQHQVQPL